MHKWWMRGSVVVALCAAGIFMLLIEDLYACRVHRLSGPLSGARDEYFQAPVIEQTVQSGLYNIYFCAFDMGHEMHVIAYAMYAESNELYKDMVRVTIRDPDGNALTVLRDHATAVLDEPVRWEYQRIGQYTVEIDIKPLKPLQRTGFASFTMTLDQSSPTPFVLMSSVGVIVATMLTVAALKRKRQNAA